MKICIITDTFCDVNGVSRFISDILKQSLEHEKNIYVITSTAKDYCEDLNHLYNLKPIVRMKMPFYKELDLVLPSYKKIRHLVDEINPDIIHISTPGLVGYYGLKIAKKRDIPVVGIYHTDFPKYVYKNTKSNMLKNIATKFMQSFYKDFSLVITRSKEYISTMHDDLKLSPSKVQFLKHGTNTEKFNPKFQDENIWTNYKIDHNHIKFLYVGRITKEKNIEFLFDVWEKVYSKNKNISLSLVGSGDIKKYKKRCKDLNIYFLGHKEKEELSSIYASSDYFIFPSTTDTLGQVVMEALASATPAIVSDVGGPQVIINGCDKKVGYVLEHDNIEVWSKKLEELINSNNLEKLSSNAREYMQEHSIDKSYEDYITLHQSILNI
jgi:glycosyltransferase involved in cell wall biosynthesis